MARTSEVKVRLGDEEEKLLDRIAKRESLTRSEVLRRSLHAYEASRRADAALADLVDWARVDEARLAGRTPRKAAFRME